MTAKQIFDTMLALMFGVEDDAGDYEPFFLPTLNYIIAENYARNNAIRILRGKQPHPKMPLIEKLTDEIDFEDEFTRQIIPMGCAGYIFMSDDKPIATAYKDKYEFERNQVFFAKYDEGNMNG
ncbi:MAG: hypothetical protein RR459_07860 [Christensenellaceae bacterium]